VHRSKLTGEFQCRTAQGVTGLVWLHHSKLEDAECHFPGHLTAGASVHTGYESQHTNDNIESLILGLFNNTFSSTT
jgi:hypothetical protein